MAKTELEKQIEARANIIRPAVDGLWSHMLKSINKYNTGQDKVNPAYMGFCVSNLNGFLTNLFSLITDKTTDAFTKDLDKNKIEEIFTTIGEKFDANKTLDTYINKFIAYRVHLQQATDKAEVEKIGNECKMAMYAVCESKITANRKGLSMLIDSIVEKPDNLVCDITNCPIPEKTAKDFTKTAAAPTAKAA